MKFSSTIEGKSINNLNFRNTIVVHIQSALASKRIFHWRNRERAKNPFKKKNMKFICLFSWETDLLALHFLYVMQSSICIPFMLQHAKRQIYWNVLIQTENKCQKSLPLLIIMLLCVQCTNKYPFEIWAKTL